MNRLRNTILFILAFSAGIACGGDDGTSPNSNGTINLTGTYIGDYTATATPGAVYQGVLQITHTGASVTGTLTTNTGRAATFVGTFSGTRITATMTFTDNCRGSASTTADVSNNGRRVTGNYNANDCLGQYAGGYLLDKQ